ncbi:hypothetical protein GCM10007338_03800 [Corynebacterium pelargi]|nr:hypothetical protein GCM10007338_03800 [Corynebacterium pelargi]
MLLHRAELGHIDVIAVLSNALGKTLKPAKHHANAHSNSDLVPADIHLTGDPVELRVEIRRINRMLRCPKFNVQLIDAALKFSRIAGLLVPEISHCSPPRMDHLARI